MRDVGQLAGRLTVGQIVLGGYRRRYMNLIAARAFCDEHSGIGLRFHAKESIGTA
jgi:hypothetical protein